MASYTGQVIQDQNGNWRFANDEDGGNNLQRLSKASIRETMQARLTKEIDLSQYKNEYLEVDGDWEHEWLLEANITKHSDKPPQGAKLKAKAGSRRKTSSKKKASRSGKTRSASARKKTASKKKTSSASKKRSKKK